MTDFGPIKVVLLAGGYGTRLAERTDAMPKPMVEIGGRPILWHILKIYSHFGFCDFLVACGWRGEVIKRFFLEYGQQMSDLVIDYANNRVEQIARSVEPWRVALIDTGIESMTGGRLKRLEEHLGDATFMMTYGDGLADVNLHDLLEFHRQHGRLATFAAVHPPSLFGRPELDGDRVVRFTEKPGDAEQWINGGFFVLEPEVLSFIADDATSLEMQTLPALAKAGELMAFRHEGFWHPMDTLRDVRNLNRLWEQEEQVPWRVWKTPQRNAAATGWPEVKATAREAGVAQPSLKACKDPESERGLPLQDLDLGASPSRVFRRAR